MDLMRTLLIYMSATMALAVQSTAAPKVTPVPTAAPDAVVETVTTPAPGEDKITAAPGAQAGDAKNTAKITPAPVPTITPNMKGYHNLTMGAKGKEVKKLQEKLIEMGYLPEGSADGAYGRKTFNAVKKFQYYNGLTADGIAGRKTQTNLFENPEIVPNPEVTAVPETPAPAIATPEAPDVTEAPETAEPKTEEAEAGTAGTEEPAAAETAESVTEVPAAEATETAEAPAETEAPKADAQETEASEEELPEVVETLDLDADVYEEITAAVALNESNGPLEYIITKDNVPMKVRPRVSQNGARIRISLDDLCKCVDTWQLTDEGAGSVVLVAAGYTLALYNESKGIAATLDGTAIPVKAEDFDFVTEGHFIDAEFLATALKGSAAWDQEENTLMLRIRDKEAVESKD